MKTTIAKNTVIRKNCPHIICEDPIEIRGGIFDIEKIGAYSYLGGGDTVIRNVSKIGRFCSIAPNVKIGLVEHPTECLSTSPIIWGGGQNIFDTLDYRDYLTNNSESIANCTEILVNKTKKKTHIGHDVWIGEAAFVRGGVSIGDGAIIAARAVVTKEVPPFAIVGGIPARIIRFRFANDICTYLLKLKWWNYPINLLNKCDLSDPSKFISFLEKMTINAKYAIYKEYKLVYKKPDILIQSVD